MKGYFNTLSKEKSLSWVIENAERLPEDVEVRDQVRMMPTWYMYIEMGECFAHMKYDAKTFEPKEQKPALTRILQTEESNELLVYDMEAQTWLSFVIEAENIEDWKVLHDKYSPFKDWIK